MEVIDNISKKDGVALAMKIRRDLYRPRNSFKISIFLCGADINDTTKIRFKISEALSDLWNSFNYDLVFPEDIFDELLYSSQGKDLLSLENLLAENIDVILIIPESPGSFAELGAFANNEKLRKKIVCLINEKYKKDKSFINQGPVKLVKKASKHRIVYIDPENIGKDFKKIQAAIRDVKKKEDLAADENNINLLQFDNFLLPLIYLLEPITKKAITYCVEGVIEDEKNSFQIATTVLTMMTKKKYIELTPFGYKLTKFGRENYLGVKRPSGLKYQKETVAFDNLRLEILNLRLRNKKLKI